MSSISYSLEKTYHVHTVLYLLIYVIITAITSVISENKGDMGNQNSLLWPHDVTEFYQKQVNDWFYLDSYWHEICFSLKYRLRNHP